MLPIAEHAPEVQAALAAQLLSLTAAQRATMAARARENADALLAERGDADRPGDPDPASYLGAAEQMVDAALARHDGRR